MKSSPAAGYPLIMSKSAAPPTEFSFKNILKEIRSPTNAGSRFIRISLIAIALGGTYYKYIRPVRIEKKFYQDEEFADNLFKLEMQQKSSKTT